MTEPRSVCVRITGLSRSRINRGADDLAAGPLPTGRVRRAGGGRKAVSAVDPGLVPALVRLVEPATRGDPMRPLLWVSKSMDKLAAKLKAMGHPVRAETVRKKLTKLGFSRQYNRKSDEVGVSLVSWSGAAPGPVLTALAPAFRRSAKSIAAAQHSQ